MARRKRRPDRNSAVDRALRAERRQSAAREACVLCAIPLSTPADSQMEDHHVGGQHHDPNATVPLCPPHHRDVTEAIRDAGADMRPQPTFARTLVHALRAVGTLLIIVGHALLAWAERLHAELLRNGENTHD